MFEHIEKMEPCSKEFFDEYDRLYYEIRHDKELLADLDRYYVKKIKIEHYRVKNKVKIEVNESFLTQLEREIRRKN